jgi:hypothetical protein
MPAARPCQRIIEHDAVQTWPKSNLVHRNARPPLEDLHLLGLVWLTHRTNQLHSSNLLPLSPVLPLSTAHLSSHIASQQDLSNAFDIGDVSIGRVQADHDPNGETGAVHLNWGATPHYIS